MNSKLLSAYPGVGISLVPSTKRIGLLQGNVHSAAHYSQRNPAGLESAACLITGLFKKCGPEAAQKTRFLLNVSKTKELIADQSAHLQDYPLLYLQTTGQPLPLGCRLLSSSSTPSHLLVFCNVVLVPTVLVNKRCHGCIMSI